MSNIKGPEISPDKKYTVPKLVNGIPVPGEFVEAEGPSAEDFALYGFNSEYVPSETSLNLNSVLRTLSGSRVLRAAGVVVLALTGASILADNHQSEASSIQPDSSDPGYTPLLPQLDSNQFVTFSGGGFTATRIHGDGAPTDLSYIIVGQDYPDDQKLLDSGQLYTQYLLSVEPFKLRQDQISISVLHKQNTPNDLVSSITSVYDVGGDSLKVYKLIDDLHLSLGSFQETRLLVNSPKYAAVASADSNTPTVYSYAAFTEAELRGPFYTRGTIAHEEGHAVGGAGEGSYSALDRHGPNVYLNCLTADQIPLRWKDIPGAPGAIYEGCGNVRTGAFHDAERDWMSNHNSDTTYGPVTLWQLKHRLDGAPAIYYPPTLLNPANGITLDGLAAALKFNPSEMTKQYQIKIVPFNNDGPGVNLIIGALEQVKAAEFNVAAPRLGEGPYVMLPDLSYIWRVRTTSAVKPVGENDPVWSDWSEERKFRTSAASSVGITPVRVGEVRVQQGSDIRVNQTNPVIQWADANPGIFYYEVQLSKDPEFGAKGPIASVYHNLVHGGIREPYRSWEVPRDYPLEKGQGYFWRVRPRVQGDGTPVGWSTTWNFEVAQNATLSAGN